MKTRSIALLLLFISLLAPTPQFGVRADEGQDGETIKVDSTLVNIPVTVSDSQGRFLPGLKKDDFELYENNVRQQIEHFSSDSMPFTIALVIDVSGSTRDRIEPIQQAATEFVNQMRADDRIAIIEFSKDIDLLCDFTSDRARLYRAIDNIRWGGSTRLYDAIYATMFDSLKSIQGRKAMILLTDGEDTRSQTTADQAIATTVESGALAYVLQYPPAPGFNAGRRSRNNDPRERQRTDRYPSPFPQDNPYPPGNRRGPGYPQPDRRQRRNRSWPWPYNFIVSNGNNTYSGNFAPQELDMSGSDFLQTLANETSGRVYEADLISDLSGLATKVAQELRYTYMLGYYPTTPLQQGGRRQVKVRMKRPDLKIRYKTGYDAGNPNSN